MPDLIRRRTTESLRVPLSDHEVCERSQALCSKLRQIEEEERDFKDVRDAYKTRVSWLEEESSRLRGEIESRVAEKELDVLKVLDLAGAEVRFYMPDDDSMQVPIHVRRITEEERQAEIGDELLEGIQHYEEEHEEGDQDTPPAPDVPEADFDNEPVVRTLADSGEEAYEAGAAARDGGLSENDNPFARGTYEWHSWRNGWIEQPILPGGEA
jgi:hypothetical protein